MNSLDIIIVVIIGLVAFRGYRRGLIKEAVSLCSVFIALFVAAHLHTIFVPHLKVYFANKGSVAALSYVIAFLATLVGLWFLVRFLQGVLKVTMLTLVDKLAGAAFGALEGFLLCLVILLFLKAVLPGTDLVRQSKLAKKTEPALVFLADITPTPVRETLHEGGFSLPKPTPLPSLHHAIAAKAKPAHEKTVRAATAKKRTPARVARKRPGSARASKVAKAKTHEKTVRATTAKKRAPARVARKRPGSARASKVAKAKSAQRRKSAGKTAKKRPRKATDETKTR